MRVLSAIFLSVFLLSAQAKAQLPFPHYNQFTDSARSDQKWHLSKYAGLSAGYFSFAGGVSFLSAPFGLLLSHPLNNNVHAFAGISAAPVFFNANRLYTEPVTNPSYPGYNFSKAYGAGLNARVEAGLMYINDAKTFSISGSFGVERGSYPVYSPAREPVKK